MADYCTTTDVKADMPGDPLYSTTDASVDAALASMITIASRLIDKELGKWDNYFYPSTDATTRYFDGVGEIEQPIDECITLSSVSVAEEGGTGATDYTEWTLDTDYYVLPYNYSQYGTPIRSLCIDWNGSKYSWGTFKKSIKVVGVFGYSLVPPEPIKMAVKIQTIRWFMRAKQAYQDASAFYDLGRMVYRQELDPDVKEILYLYKLENTVI